MSKQHGLAMLWKGGTIHKLCTVTYTNHGAYTHETIIFLDDTKQNGSSSEGTGVG